MSSKINLLVIDDDDINVFIIKKIVEKTAFDVTMVAKENGQVALDYLATLGENHYSLPDLILVDINMPVLNGWEFIEAYEALSNNLLSSDIYMLSSSVYENDIERAKTYKSVKGFISKPLSIERLTELLRSVESEG